MTGRGRNPGKRKLPDPNAEGALHVTDGQQKVGSVVRVGPDFFAFDAAGRCIGAFDSAIQAARKIPAVERRS
jgi:hypothetical protein